MLINTLPTCQETGGDLVFWDQNACVQRRGEFTPSVTEPSDNQPPFLIWLQTLPLHITRRDAQSDGILGNQQRKQQSLFHYTILPVCPSRFHFFFFCGFTSHFRQSLLLVRLIFAESPKRTGALASLRAETSGDSHSRAASEGETLSTLFWQQALCGEKSLKGPHN